MTAQDIVRKKHPAALCVYHNDHVAWKVYADEVSWVALSAGFPSQSEAWRDAALAVEKKELCHAQASQGLE